LRDGRYTAARIRFKLNVKIAAAFSHLSPARIISYRRRDRRIDAANLSGKGG
jgi:hypothetical protein